jgi:acyl-CoA synthetase (AMP-forming)/AMP-acid ligase II
LEGHAEKSPSASAIAAPGREPTTYARLYAHTEYVRDALTAAGLGGKDRVAIVLPSGPEMAVAFLSISAVATCAPLNPALSQREFDFYLSDARAKTLVIEKSSPSPARAAALERGIQVVEIVPRYEGPAGLFAFEGLETPSASAARPLDPGDIALLLHTSGTTARPKLVPLAHESLYRSAENISRTLALDPGDRCLNLMPLFHIHGLVGSLLSSLYAGGSVCCAQGVDPHAIREWLRRERPSWITAVPTILQALLESVEGREEIVDALRLRLIRSSSAAMSPELMGRLERTFKVPVIESYGMTEAAHQMASNPLPPRVRKPKSVGLPAGPEIAIMSGEGQALPAGERGEIVIRGGNVMAGYENNLSANQEAFTGGWFRTGDEGFFDADGYLFLTGRIKEMINRGGEKISPREIDEVLVEHDAVSQAVTFAVPHPTLGEDVAAAVVLEGGRSVTEPDLHDFCARALAAHKLPRQILFLDELPKGPSGKLLRIGLAKRFADKLRAPFQGPRNQLETHIAAAFRDSLDVDSVGVHDNFFALGGDSLRAITVVTSLQGEGIRLSADDIFRNPTVARLAESAADTPSDISDGQSNAPHPAWKDLMRALRSESPEIEDAYPLTPFQLSFVRAKPPEGSVLVAWTLRGALDKAMFKSAWQRVASAQTPLRTSFRMTGPLGEPVQVVKRSVELPWEEHDLRGLEPSEREEEARRIQRTLTARAFDVSRSPLAHMALILLEEEVARFLWSRHQAIGDLWTALLLEREAFEAYAALREGKEASFDLPRPFRDYVRWLEAREKSSLGPFWQDELRALDWQKLPLRLRFHATQAQHGACVLWTADETTRLREACRQTQITVSTFLHGMWSLLLSSFYDTHDVLFGCVLSGRWADFDGANRVMGPLTNLLPLRVRLDPEARCSAWLQQLQLKIASLQTQTHVSLDDVSAFAACPQRVLPGSTYVVVENHPARLWERSGAGLEVSDFEQMECNPTTMHLHALLLPDKMAMEVRYDPRAIDADVAQRAAGALRLLGTTMIANLRRPLAKVRSTLDGWWR